MAKAPKTTVKATPKTPKLQEFWAMCRFYEPFIFGGDVWQKKRYKVLAVPVVVCGFDCFIFFDENYSKEWKLCEKETGGHIAEGKTKAATIKTATGLINETPDFRKQVATLGTVMNHTETTADEALKRLHKSEKK